MRILYFSLILILQIKVLNALELQGKFEQGSFILGKTSPNSEIQIDSKKIRVSKEGFFAFGLDRDRKNDVVIKVTKDGETKILKKKVLKREYKIQRIDGLPPKQVTPPPEVYKRIKKDNILIGKARSIDTANDFFKDNFIYPIDKYIITGVYGSQRILNGKPRRPHYGIDFHAPEGTPVKYISFSAKVISPSIIALTGVPSGA